MLEFLQFVNFMITVCKNTSHEVGIFETFVVLGSRIRPGTWEKHARLESSSATACGGNDELNRSTTGIIRAVSAQLYRSKACAGKVSRGIQGTRRRAACCLPVNGCGLQATVRIADARLAVYGQDETALICIDLVNYFPSFFRMRSELIGEPYSGNVP
jgi:hypothetical protein